MLCGDLNGKEIQKEGYVYAQLIPFAVQQNLIRLLLQGLSGKELACISGDGFNPGSG